MNMYNIYSWKEHLKEAKDEMGGGVRWFGGTWGVTLFSLHSLMFLCRMHQESWVTAQIFQ